MTEVVFLLNGTLVRLDNPTPSDTLLNWLRDDQRLTGTKEGCNEGDCGACTVLLTDPNGSRAVNACILFLPQIHGKAVRTVEGVSGPNGELHPVQSAMIEHHASQCGFCTPGFVMALIAAHMNGSRDHDQQLAGNLCRCTGYASIIRAAKAAQEMEIPGWLSEDLSRLAVTDGGSDTEVPKTIDELAKWYHANPDALLISGATEVGLSVTKELKPLGKAAYLSKIPALAKITETDGFVQIGAGVSIAELENFISGKHPDFGKMLQRFGSVQVRNSGTIGGNIANGSPIADTPPALMALGARLHLRHGESRRELMLEDYYIAYGKQDRKPGEFIEKISIPHQVDRLKCYKLSKRFDQDISAVMGCFSIQTEGGTVKEAQIAFGGMAATVKRATAVENSLLGQPWERQTIDQAMAAFPEDFQPLTDFRAGAEYRLMVSKNMLLRYFLEDQGNLAQVLEVTT